MATRYSSLYAGNTTNGTSSGAITTTTSYSYKGPTVTKAGEDIQITGSYNFANGVLDASNTQLFLCALPSGGKVKRIQLAPSADLDSGNSFTFNLGTVASATAFASASTALQATTGFSTPATIATDADQQVTIGASESLIVARAAGAVTNTTGILYFMVEVGIPA